MMARCINCGQTIRNGANFCQACGSSQASNPFAGGGMTEQYSGQRNKNNKIGIGFIIVILVLLVGGLGLFLGLKASNDEFAGKNISEEEREAEATRAAKNMEEVEQALKEDFERAEEESRKYANKSSIHWATELERSGYIYSASYYTDNPDYGTDNYGHVYDGILYANASNGQELEYVVYYIYNVSRLTGKIFVNQAGSRILGTDDVWNKACVNVYADGELLQSYSGFGPNVTPIDLNLDISGTEKLKFEFINTKINDGKSQPIICIGDCEVN